MIINNVLFDVMSGRAYNGQGQMLNHKWITYPDCLAPESASKMLSVVGNFIAQFWGEGKIRMDFDGSGYAIFAEKGDGKTFTANLGTLAVFENQHGTAALLQDIERRLIAETSKAPAAAAK